MFRFARRSGCALAALCVLMFAAPVAAQTATAPKPQEKPVADLPSAQSIIDRHLEAVGGRKSIANLNSVRMTAAITVPANGMTGTMEIFAARPNKRLEKSMIEGIGENKQGFDGTHAWMMTPVTGPMLHTGDELIQQRNDSSFETMLDPSTRYSAMKTLEKTTFDGKEVYKVSLTRKEGGEDIDFYDVATGLKAGSINTRKSPMGSITVTSSLSEYKKFGDLLQPTRLKQSFTGVEIITTITSIEYNKVDPAVFELPAEIKALIK